MFTSSYKEETCTLLILPMHIEHSTLLKVKLNFKDRGSSEYFKELCEYLYVLPLKLKPQKPFQHQLLAVEELRKIITVK